MLEYARETFTIPIDLEGNCAINVEIYNLADAIVIFFLSLDATDSKRSIAKTLLQSLSMCRDGYQEEIVVLQFLEDLFSTVYQQASNIRERKSYKDFAQAWKSKYSNNSSQIFWLQVGNLMVS